MDNIPIDTPEEIKNLLVELRFISNVPSDHKINLQESSYISSYTSSHSYIGAILRFWYKENQSKIIDHISNLIKTSLVLMNKYPIYKELIKKSLIETERGITNLIETYKRKGRDISELEILKVQVSPNSVNPF